MEIKPLHFVICFLQTYPRYLGWWRGRGGGAGVPEHDRGGGLHPRGRHDRGHPLRQPDQPEARGLLRGQRGLGPGHEAATRNISCLQSL